MRSGRHGPDSSVFDPEVPGARPTLISYNCRSRASFPAFRRHSRSAHRAASPVVGGRCRGRRRRHAPAGRRPAGRPTPSCRRSSTARLARRRQLPVPDRGRPGLQLDDSRPAGHPPEYGEHTRDDQETAVPNGTYWWRVRAVTKTGQVSGWSTPRSVRKAWTAAPTLRGPVNGAHVLSRLSRSRSPGRRCSGPPSISSRSRPTRISPHSWATTRSRPPARLRALIDSVGRQGQDLLLGRHPLDAQGNRGAQSRIASFVWEWPSQTSAKLTDLRAEPERSTLSSRGSRLPAQRATRSR